MNFYVNAGDGTSGRYADTLQFVDDRGVTYTVAIARTIDYTPSVTVVGANGERHELADVDDAGRQIARLLVLCRDQSLVVDTARGTQARGDESTTADVYPPRQHPRIIVKG
ncbi:hypothetical protein [Cellulosimicrobium sp. NPDC057862]|uniref:hypothetical protein n=1 Tax=Actinomycetes TaxID=1760 RepID=UPI00366C1A6F